MKFQSKIVEIEAVQYHRHEDNWAEVFKFCDNGSEIQHNGNHVRIWVQANQEWLTIEDGEWIIRDELGIYPCKDAVFQRKYQPAEQDHERHESIFGRDGTYHTIAPECFTNGSVISYKGENYYKACGAFVTNEMGDEGEITATSTCIKPKNHRSTEHEDYAGRKSCGCINCTQAMALAREGS